MFDIYLIFVSYLFDIWPNAATRSFVALRLQFGLLAIQEVITSDPWVGWGVGLIPFQTKNLLNRFKSVIKSRYPIVLI